jgi:type II secretory pathway pseudopilin PulG
MKKNNKGFSLVELIVIIALMAVLTTSIITYIGMVGDAQAKKCANGLSSGLSQTKVCAMSRSKASITVYGDDTGVYIKTVQGNAERTEKIGKDGVKVEFRTIRDSDVFTPVGTTLDSGVKIEFDRASGACKKMSNGEYCYGFKVTAGQTTYIVNIEPLTGKASIQ